MKANISCLVLSLVGCALLASAGRAAPTETKEPYTWVDAGDPAVAAVVGVGERTIDHLARSLLVEVKRTLDAMTPAVAVGKLHLKDYKIPAAAPGQPVVTAVRRTSLNLRNPANTPDAADRAALELFKHRLDDGDDLPKVMLQKIEVPGQPIEWRVYRPLGLAQQCIVCHGTKESLDPDVKTALQLFFPEDKALDYMPGAWRGLIRVSVAPAAPSAPKKP